MPFDLQVWPSNGPDRQACITTEAVLVLLRSGRFAAHMGEACESVGLHRLMAVEYRERGVILWGRYTGDPSDKWRRMVQLVAYEQDWLMMGGLMMGDTPNA